MRKLLLEHVVIELVYKFDGKSYHESLKKVSRLLMYDSNIFIHKTHYLDTNIDHSIPIALRVLGNYT